jgi:hypothetical protein
LLQLRLAAAFAASPATVGLSRQCSHPYELITSSCINVCRTLTYMLHFSNIKITSSQYLKNIFRCKRRPVYLHLIKPQKRRKPRRLLLLTMGNQPPKESPKYPLNLKIPPLPPRPLQMKPQMVQVRTSLASMGKGHDNGGFEKIFNSVNSVIQIRQMA